MAYYVSSAPVSPTSGYRVSSSSSSSFQRLSSSSSACGCAAPALAPAVRYAAPTSAPAQEPIPVIRAAPAKTQAPAPVFQSADLWNRQVTAYEHGIRTATDGSVTAGRALEKLMEGNHRFVNGNPAPKNFRAEHREALQAHGQRPMATIIGCADSRCSVEVLFDAIPGDVFVLRNAGNTLSNAEGSMVGSAEYSVCNLGTNLIVVLGHTHCGAIAGATKCMLDNKGCKPDPKVKKSCLQMLLGDLEPVAAQAQLELPVGAQADEIAAHAVYVNAFDAVEKLLSYSAPLREKAMEGALEVHAAVYDIVSGKVEFLGQHPRLPLLLNTQSKLFTHPPST